METPRLDSGRAIRGPAFREDRAAPAAPAGGVSDSVALSADSADSPWRRRVVLRGAAMVRGVAAARANLPLRPSRAARVEQRCRAAGLGIGLTIGSAVGGPVGLAVGSLLGMAAGRLVSTILLAPGWSQSSAAPTPEPPPTGSDLQLDPATDSPLLDAGFQRRLDRLTGAPLRDGNRVRLLPSGPDSFAERYQIIRAATKSIDLQTYIFHDDEAGRTTADLLMQKARAGVDVRVVIDGVGSADTRPALLDEMRRAGVKVVEFAPPAKAIERINHRWHQKLLVMDGKTAVVGGMNVGSEYAYSGSGHVDVSRGPDSPSALWKKDTDAALEGPAVADVARTFDDNWRRATGERLPAPTPQPPQGGGVAARFIRHLPKDGVDGHLLDWYVAMLGKATRTAYIANAYFVPDDRLVDAMVAAAKRGVDVRVLTNSPDTTDHAVPMVQHAGRRSYQRLIEGGVRVYEATSPGKVLRVVHKKTAVFDGVVSAVGSYNLDPRSEHLNSEDLLEVHGADFGARMGHMFADDLRRAHEVSVTDLHSGTVLDRFEQWLFGDVLRSQL